MITKVTPAKFSVEEYHKIIDAGILAYRKVELIDEIIVEMAPEGTEHSYYGQSLALSPLAFPNTIITAQQIFAS